MFGDVDAGKSTILGRLMVDCGHVPKQKLEEMGRSSEKRGVPIEYSFLLDAFQVERDQAITLDISRIWLKTPKREIVFVDAPGHRELIRNLVSGASEVDAVVLVVAADEGITAQTRRQALFLQWFGLDSAIVVINKLDLTGEPEPLFTQRSQEVREFLARLGITPVSILPVAARDGANLAAPGAATAWWKGPTLLQSLESLSVHQRDENSALRFVVQDVYRRGTTRWIAGRVDTGRLTKGSRLTFWPLNTAAGVARIVRWPSDVEQARGGDAVAIELDERIFVDRGAIATLSGDEPEIGHAISAAILWLGTSVVQAGQSFRMRIGTRELPVTLTKIEETFDPETGIGSAADSISAGDVAQVTLVSRESIAVDAQLRDSSIARFVLLGDGLVVAGGKVRGTVGATRGGGATNVIATASSVRGEERSSRNAHTGRVFWLTGLPSAGKSTLAMRAQRMLFDRGRQVYVLDGDTLRTRLNVDLGFSDEDRQENVRRTAAVAGLLADAGFVVITALISPFAADRENARATCIAGFDEIYVGCDLKTAEERDVKGLYRKARAGELDRFTGVSSPYEIPQNPSLTIDTTSQSVDESAGQLFEFIERAIAL